MVEGIRREERRERGKSDIPPTGDSGSSVISFTTSSVIQ